MAAASPPLSKFGANFSSDQLSGTIKRSGFWECHPSLAKVTLYETTTEVKISTNCHRVAVALHSYLGCLIVISQLWRPEKSKTQGSVGLVSAEASVLGLWLATCCFVGSPQTFLCSRLGRWTWLTKGKTFTGQHLPNLTCTSDSILSFRPSYPSRKMTSP